MALFMVGASVLLFGAAAKNYWQRVNIPRGKSEVKHRGLPGKGVEIQSQWTGTRMAASELTHPSFRAHGYRTSAVEHPNFTHTTDYVDPPLGEVWMGSAAAQRDARYRERRPRLRHRTAIDLPRAVPLHSANLGQAPGVFG